MMFCRSFEYSRTQPCQLLSRVMVEQASGHLQKYCDEANSRNQRCDVGKHTLSTSKSCVNFKTRGGSWVNDTHQWASTFDVADGAPFWSTWKQISARNARALHRAEREQRTQDHITRQHDRAATFNIAGLCGQPCDLCDFYFNDMDPVTDLPLLMPCIRVIGHPTQLLHMCARCWSARVRECNSMRPRPPSGPPKDESDDQDDKEDDDGNKRKRRRGNQEGQNSSEYLGEAWQEARIVSVACEQHDARKNVRRATIADEEDQCMLGFQPSELDDEFNGARICLKKSVYCRSPKMVRMAIEYLLQKRFCFTANEG